MVTNITLPAKVLVPIQGLDPFIVGAKMQTHLSRSQNVVNITLFTLQFLSHFEFLPMLITELATCKSDQRLWIFSNVNMPGL